MTIATPTGSSRSAPSCRLPRRRTSGTRPATQIPRAGAHGSNATTSGAGRFSASATGRSARRSDQYRVGSDPIRSINYGSRSAPRVTASIRFRYFFATPSRGDACGVASHRSNSPRSRGSTGSTPGGTGIEYEERYYEQDGDLTHVIRSPTFPAVQARSPPFPFDFAYLAKSIRRVRPATGRSARRSPVSCRLDHPGSTSYTGSHAASVAKVDGNSVRTSSPWR